MYLEFSIFTLTVHDQDMTIDRYYMSNIDGFKFLLLSRLFKVGLKKTIEWFHVFFFGKQNMVGKVLKDLKKYKESETPIEGSDDYKDH